MKKTRKVMVGIFASSLLVLAACNEETTVEDPAPEDTPVEQEADGDMIHTDEGMDTDVDEVLDPDSDEPETTAFGFSYLHLNVNYSDLGDSYTIHYEHTTDEVNAEIDDSRMDMQLTGDEAYQELENRFENFQIDSEMSEEEILAAIHENFDFDPNYESLELEMTLENGTEINFEHESEE
ncbi:YusW family protein [Halalkalibacter nanhaiisediminis]|uniref:YusW-like protein n=1 Tax=Halalkalibacter nanhaiisediminis TaxID=688079 RepID=A0A562QQT7_9BACI|nr:YusW family protein [Halalkalibacter nanhaiisediminis]TWI59121.1 YusW-like protein [Halalkalibacter nanhaiisediminis]